jgi:hypothetical protein
MENPENTERAITNGQSREYRKGNHKWTIQRIKKGQSQMDNPENTESAITNRQSRETGNMGNTRHNMKLLKTTGGKYEANIVFMWKL